MLETTWSYAVMPPLSKYASTSAEGQSPDRRSWRFSLLTLVILAGIAPPVLALLWFLLIILSFQLNEIINQMASVNLWATFALSLCCVLPWPERTTKAAAVPMVLVVVLGICQFLAMWLAWATLGFLAGWLYVWGDNRPSPASQTALLVTSIAIPACIAAIAGVRIRLKTVPPSFVKLVTYGTVACGVMSACILWYTSSR